MKIPFILYAHGLGLYSLLTLPLVFTLHLSCAGVFAVYVVSLAYAISFGLIAMILFFISFVILHYLRSPKNTAIITLLSASVASVGTAYEFLLLIMRDDPQFFRLDDDIVFPVTAAISGMIAVAINVNRIRRHFERFTSHQK